MIAQDEVSQRQEIKTFVQGQQNAENWSIVQQIFVRVHLIVYKM